VNRRVTRAALEPLSYLDYIANSFVCVYGSLEIGILFDRVSD